MEEDGDVNGTLQVICVDIGVLLKRLEKKTRARMRCERVDEQYREYNSLGSTGLSNSKGAGKALRVEASWKEFSDEEDMSK